MVDVEKVKKEFLRLTQCRSKDKAMCNALLSALFRGRVYCSEYNADKIERDEFKRYWAECIEEIVAQYVKPVSDEVHCRNIVGLSKRVSRKHKSILRDGRLRIGTAQKSLNVYLKYLWCMGEVAMPNHCPVDAIILRMAGISGSWTKCDSIKEYRGWVERLARVAGEGNLKLAEWELVVWDDKMK